MRGQVVKGTSCRKSGGSSKECRALVKKIEAAGGEIVSTGKSGHLKVYLDTTFIGALAGTPSDHRTWKNDIARLRRNGLKI